MTDTRSPDAVEAAGLREALWAERVAAGGLGATRSSAYQLGWQAGFGDAAEYLCDVETPTAEWLHLRICPLPDTPHYVTDEARCHRLAGEISEAYRRWLR